MIDKLEFVLALARERHFGRAAEACGVTQPTLSAGLKSLEETLGVLIVQRSSRFQEFTPEGARVLEWARRMVGDAKALRLDLAAMKHGLEGHVRIAAIPTALPIVAQLTTPLIARHPSLRFTVLSRPSAVVLQLLDDLQIDAGLTYLDNEPLGHVRTVPLYQERYCLLTARDGAIGDRAAVAWADAAALSLCLLTPDMQNRRIIDDMLRACGQSPAPKLVSDSLVTLLAHVRTGQWSSIMPRSLVESVGLPPTIVSVPLIEPDLQHAVGLVVARHDPGTPIVQSVVAEAQRLADQLRAGPG